MGYVAETGATTGWSEGEPEPVPEVLTWADLARISHADARRKGWHDGAEPNSSRQVDAWRMLVLTELAEAAECIRRGEWETTIRDDGKPEGLPSELADVAIRIADMMGALGMSWGGFVSSEMRANLTPRADARDPVKALATLWRTVGRWASARSNQSMAAVADWLAEDLGVDLNAEVRRKLIYNRTRPHRHGGKLA